MFTTYYRLNLDVNRLRKLHLLALRALVPFRLPLPVGIHVPVAAETRRITTAVTNRNAIRARNFLSSIHFPAVSALRFTFGQMFQSAAHQCMQLVANARALLAWLFTLVQAPQDGVEREAPEEEACGCAAGEE